ncbi:uncharacterized protein EV154DRAFT_483968 [Mucor mucedo]|uniref:uncharacterized protein n=1 Tax=Mucor mucedo TaxID=29922 RepID=UPI00221E9B67|nr:uncharacterized protein EV154DRAFT_483968 [Mucor mucedo]KAI7888626.1 hypothetical protein EV154DRAFT_483968 [Mucor mucedo]
MVKSNTPTDQSTIPRPLNCFLMYRLEKQKEIVAKCAGANHRDISKIIAKWWQEASEEEKKPFRERARIAKMEHRQLYPDYKYTPKKKTTPKRVYIRKNKKEQFTSRAKENNKFMELIYDDCNALEFATEEIESTSSKRIFNSGKVTKKTSKVTKKRAANTVVMQDIYENFEDYKPLNYHNDCQYATSVSSHQSIPDFFNSPQTTSPSTDCYSDADVPTPCVELSPFEATMSYSINPFENFSSYNVLDTPCINEFNAYSPVPFDTQVDYFHFDHSISNKFVEDFSYSEYPDFCSTEQYQSSFLMMQVPDQIQYIDPALLHM